jgi:threonyl-tRNA synthetase
MIKIKFPDGSERKYDKGITAFEIAKSISEGLARNTVTASLNGVLMDRNIPINEDVSIKFHTLKDNKGMQTFWHSTAHLMAEALEELFPGIKFGYGPATEQGFFYDVEPPEGLVISSDHFQQIEKKMIELARKKSEYIRSEVSKKEAIEYFTKKGDEYKLDLIEDLEDGDITFYTQGNFIDLCKGPHIPNTSLIKAVKLLKVGGVYWKGDEENKQLIRISGVSFPKISELKDHLSMLEEAKKRDHRKIGKELELFMFSERVGAGLPMWLPKGNKLRQRLINYLIKRQEELGYQQVVTPHLGKKELYVTSGHYEKYGEDSFRPMTTPKKDEEFMIKPMNCPHHCEMFKFRPRSYKDLPLRFSEFGTVYRYEQSGELHGLSRVRGFTQDDAHIFCTPDQVLQEFISVVEIVQEVLDMIGFAKVTAQISLRDPENLDKYIGSEENWIIAERSIIEACEQIDIDTEIVLGEAAFYGPKLDFMVEDALKRKWQLGTVQVDYTLPERFNLEYIGQDNQSHCPVMIHRAPFGSMERFISILIEHTGGKFPLWLAPEQFVLLPISEKYNDYCDSLRKILSAEDIFGFVDDRNERIGKKIRDAEAKQIPFMLIIGEKEMESKSVSLRIQGEGDKGIMKINDFISHFRATLDGTK